MDSRPVVWEQDNLKHLADHPERGITRADVEDVMHDPDRSQDPDPKHGSTVEVGRTRAGRMLVVAWVDHRKGRKPIHFRPAGRHVRRRHDG